MMENPKPTFTRKIQIQLIVLTAIFGFLIAPRVVKIFANEQELAKAPQGVSVTASTSQSFATDHFANLNLTAKSAYVWDIKAHRELYNFHGNIAHPLASITKVMMAVVVSELLPENAGITIAPEDLRFDGDQGLQVGEQWSLGDLLNLTLVSSSNDGASALAAAAGAALTKRNDTPEENKRAFITAMNAKAHAIGLEHTEYRNESGLDLESYQSGASGSARDMAMLFEYVYRKHPELLQATTKGDITVTSKSAVTHHVLNTNDIVDQLPGIIGSKTGYTELAGGNLVIIEDIGIDHPVAIAVLGSTREDRFRDVEKLINATINTITEAP